MPMCLYFDISLFTFTGRAMLVMLNAKRRHRLIALISHIEFDINLIVTAL